MCQTIGCCRGAPTFICTTYRTTAKRLDVGATHVLTRAQTNRRAHPRCPKCRQPMTNFGLQVAVPRKGRERAWRRLLARGAA